MKKIVFTFGGISGLILATMMFITIPMYENGTLDFGKGQYIGYTTMVIALSLTFFGVKRYRDQQPGGSITFGTALKTGIFISLVASGIYVIAWEITLAFLSHNFMEMYSNCRIKLAESNGASPEALSKLTAEMQSMSEWYKNPLLRMAITFMEIFPVGLVVSLITAAVLRKKQILPA